MTSWRSLPKSSRAFNRQSVQGAIAALQTSLKRYKSIPAEGIALFAGVQPIPGSQVDAEVATAGNSSAPISSASSSTSSSERERLMVRQIDMIKPLRKGTYWCGATFQTEALEEQLADHMSFGFVIVDGAGCNMYEVAGDSYRLVWKHGDPGLPNKHGRGGQSAPRFGRLREAARAAWVSTVATQLNTAFTDRSTGNVSVAGIVLCGSGSLKQQVYLRDNVLDARVHAAIFPTLVDIQYGGHAGIQEAMKKAAPLMEDQAFAQQRSALLTFMNGIADDTRLVCFGATDTMHALDTGAIATLLISEELSYNRISYVNSQTQETCIEYALDSEATSPIPASVRRIANLNSFRAVPDLFGASSSTPARGAAHNGGEGSVANSDWRVEHIEPLLDFLVGSVQQHGVAVQLISSASTQGAQFNTAFGGIGAILRWAAPLPSEEEDLIEDSEEDEYDFDF